MANVSNPELLRYIRSELRPSRVAIIMLGTLAGALLMALFIFVSSNARQLEGLSYWRNVHLAIFLSTSMILVLWSLLNASQAVVVERTQRTFDFWRTTRLTPLTLALGKLFGAPLPAWLTFATAFPVLLFTGIMAQYKFLAVVGSILAVALFNVTLSAIALSGSMRAPDARRANVFMLLMLVLLFAIHNDSLHLGAHERVVSAWTALSPALAVSLWQDGSILRVMLFGYAVPSLLVTVALCLGIVAWCLVALVRGIKLEPDQISLFSPAQVVGVSASVLLFVYAAFRPVAQASTELSSNLSQLVLQGLIATGVSAALACLYFTMNATLLSRDNLRHELRTRPAVRIVPRMIAPWLATGAVALFAAVLALNGYRSVFSGTAPNWSAIVLMYFSMIAYAVRDGMFLQWMISERVKAPVLKGALLLGAYYLGCSTGAAIVAGPEHMADMLRWLVPSVTTVGQSTSGSAWLSIVALLPPVATAGLIAVGIFRKMQQNRQAAAALARA